METAGRVDDDDVAPVPHRAFDRVEGHGGGVRPTLGAHELRVRTLGPDLELLLGRRAERVRGSEHD